MYVKIRSGVSIQGAIGCRYLSICELTVYV